jgi:hypothetical protein
VLSQVQGGQYRVRAYYSKTLNKARKNYCISRRELLAIVRTLQYFHKYFYCRSSPAHLPLCTNLADEFLRTPKGKQPAGFSVCMNKTLLPSTVKAEAQQCRCCFQTVMPRRVSKSRGIPRSQACASCCSRSCGRMGPSHDKEGPTERL